MALSGELKDFGLLQLLTLVQVTGKSGALSLQRSGEVATLYFENGRLAKAKAPNGRSGGLVTALYRAGRITHEQYEMIGGQAPPSEKAVGLLLEDQGALSREEIADFVREKSLADLYSLLTWPEGTFRMEVGILPPEEDIVAPVDLGPILDRGRRYLDEWQTLVSYVPDLDRPLRLLPEPRGHQEEVRLTPAQWRFVATLAADQPLREVAQKLGLDEFAVRQVAYRLIDAGLAEVVEPPPIVLPTYQEEPQEPEQPKGGTFSWLFGQRRR